MSVAAAPEKGIMSKRQRVDVLSGGVQVVGELKTRNENMLGLRVVVVSF